MNIHDGMEFRFVCLGHNWWYVAMKLRILKMFCNAYCYLQSYIEKLELRTGEYLQHEMLLTHFLSLCGWHRVCLNRKYFRHCLRETSRLPLSKSLGAHLGLAAKIYITAHQQNFGLRPYHTSQPSTGAYRWRFSVFRPGYNVALPAEVGSFSPPPVCTSHRSEDRDWKLCATTCVNRLSVRGVTGSEAFRHHFLSESRRVV
jgi:hypothetical protein